MNNVLKSGPVVGDLMPLFQTSSTHVSATYFAAPMVSK